MKKIIAVLLLVSCVVGCACSVTKASDAVKEYLGKYKNRSEEVMSELDKVVEDEDLNDQQKEKYKEVMKKQYEDLSYKIVSENYNGDEAVVTTKITVYDLYNVQKEAEEYKTDHKEEFIDEDGNYTKEKFLDYKLEQMQKNTKTIDYTIDFKVKKENGKWTLDTISTEDLEKIHGIYNYSTD